MLNPGKDGKIRKIDAIYLLVGGNISGASDGSEVTYHDGQTPPTEEEIKTKLKELQDDYDAKEYQRDRQPEYPAIGDQLDMLFHAIDAGKVDKTSDFYKSLKAVKDKYPKG
jgi:hypothetical protein